MKTKDEYFREVLHSITGVEPPAHFRYPQNDKSDEAQAELQDWCSRIVMEADKRNASNHLKEGLTKMFCACLRIVEPNLCTKDFDICTLYSKTLEHITALVQEQTALEAQNSEEASSPRDDYDKGVLMQLEHVRTQLARIEYEMFRWTQTIAAKLEIHVEAPRAYITKLERKLLSSPPAGLAAQFQQDYLDAEDRTEMNEIIMTAFDEPAVASFPPAKDILGARLYCDICHEPQYETPHGIVCKKGHGGAPGRPKRD